MSDKPKCYRCGKEGGFLARYFACQANHCRAQNRPICTSCLKDLGQWSNCWVDKCPACEVGHMKVL